MSSLIHRHSGIKILLVADQSIVGLSLAELLNRHFTCFVSEEDFSTLFDQIDRLRPNHIIFALDCKTPKYFQILSDILTEGYKNTSVFTSDLPIDLQDKLLLAGLKGVLDGGMKPEHIIKATRKLCDGEIWLNRKAMARLIGLLSKVGQHEPTGGDRQLISALTKREFQIAKICSANLGATNSELAKKLFLSENTVRNCLSSMFSTLAVKNRYEFFLFLLNNKNQFEE
jgi:DNA-binding NarL/FixJ family response regulator